MKMHRCQHFLAIISAIFTKLLQLKWSETNNYIRYWDSFKKTLEFEILYYLISGIYLLG